MIASNKASRWSREGSASVTTRKRSNKGSFAPIIVRQTGYCNHSYSRTTGQSIFHFSWKDIESAGDDEVLLAIDDEHLPALVHTSDITGMNPPVSQPFGGESRWRQ